MEETHMEPPVFVLVPLNLAAQTAAVAPLNAHLKLSEGFRISFEDSNKPEITIGGYDCDIVLPNNKAAEVSRRQCSFVINQNRGAVFLVDHSTKKNTQPVRYGNSGGQVVPYASHGSRSILVAPFMNTHIGLGKDNYFIFELRWEKPGLYDFPDKSEHFVLGPRHGEKRYVEGELIGGGSFAGVFWALDIAEGKTIAVKRFHESQKRKLIFAQREVDNLLKLNKSSVPHDHIIEILDCVRGTKKDYILEIFMPFKDGNLKHLVEDEPELDLADQVLQQMLLALDCLAQHGMIHRDVKPENILWEHTGRGDYHFCLGDFSLSHDVNNARSAAGTEPFMAPEILSRQSQTAKVDIWSLFSTIVWVRNTDNFRSVCQEMAPWDIQSLIISIAAMPEYHLVREMANKVPSRRPSAWKLLKITAKLPTAFSGTTVSNNTLKSLQESQHQTERMPADGFGDNAENSAMSSSLQARPKTEVDYDDWTSDYEGSEPRVSRLPYDEPYPPWSSYYDDAAVEPEDVAYQLYQPPTAEKKPLKEVLVPDVSNSDVKSDTAQRLEIQPDHISNFGEETNLNIESISGDKRTLTDEGYASATTRTSKAKGDSTEEDSTSVYSEFSEISVKVESYVSELAADLLSKLPSDPATLHRVAAVLAEKLRQFALRVGDRAPSQLHRDLMVFIHKHRQAITASFKERCLADDDESAPAAARVDKMSVAELMDLWGRSSEHDEGLATHVPIDLPEKDYSIEESSSVDTNELFAYRETIFQSPAYNWLIKTLRREFYIDYAPEDGMGEVRKAVLQCLPTAYRLSRKRSSGIHKANFHIHWNLPGVLDNHIPQQKALCRNAITLTATNTMNVQCLPCIAYMRQIWPFTGESVLNFVANSLVEHSATLQSQLPDNTVLSSTFDVFESVSIITAIGTADSLAELAEQLGWLVAALANSPLDRGIAYASPIVTELNHKLQIGTMPEFDFEIRCQIRSPQGDDSQIDGQCWHGLFQNPVAVYGYPILRRSQPNPGLEVSLEVMAALLDEYRINVFRSKIYMKGYNAALGLTKRVEDIIIWHFVCNEDQSYISYLDERLGKVRDTVHLPEVQSYRHTVGWCAKATYHAGAADANYDVKSAQLPKPHSGCVLEKCSIQAGLNIVPGLEFALRVPHKSVRITRNGYIQRLKWISKKFVVFWDENEKRGWLVNGASALLHLVRASLEHDRRDKFSSACIFDPKSLIEARQDHQSDSAISVLLNKLNRRLKIYDDDDEEKEDDKNRHHQRQDEESYHFQQRVTELAESLEKIISYEISANEEKGLKIKIRALKHLEGWDFNDLAMDNDPLFPRVATLGTLGKGWVDLTRSIHAVTLFGKGFGDIIRPSMEENSTCDYWATLPKNRYYLAATREDLEEVAKYNHGNMRSCPMRLTDSIIWHNPGPEKCQCQSSGPGAKKLRKGHSTGKHSEFAQVLLPYDSSQNGYRMAGAFSAFVFGHNFNFPGKWATKEIPHVSEATEATSPGDAHVSDPEVGSSATASSRTHDRSSWSTAEQTGSSQDT